MLAVGFFGTGGDVEDACTRTQAADVLVRHPRAGGTGKDVDAMAARGKLAREFADVDVHAAGFFTAQSFQRAGMDAEHGNIHSGIRSIERRFQ